MHCCGGQSYSDYKNSEWSNNLQINNIIGFKQDNIAPLSCCDYYDRNKDTQDSSHQTCPICLDALSGQNPIVCNKLNPKLWKTVSSSIDVSALKQTYREVLGTNNFVSQET